MNKLPLLGIPGGAGAGGSGPGDPPNDELPDGYYRISMPVGAIAAQVPGAWVLSPKLHDGNLSDGYTTGDQGSGLARMAVMAAKAAGMPVQSVDYRHGYANSGATTEMVGAQSILGPWTPISFGAGTGSLAHLDNFQWESLNSTGAPGTPYRYLALMLTDSGGLHNEVGCADLKWKNSGVDIGPP